MAVKTEGKKKRARALNFGNDFMWTTYKTIYIVGCADCFRLRRLYGVTVDKGTFYGCVLFISIG